jgi:hypothetical protein
MRLVDILRPGAVVSEHCHQCDADDADQYLHPYIIRDFDERDMRQDRKENTEAEHFKRSLAALDGRPERQPVQARPVARHEPRDEERQDHEMNEAVGREIGLVIASTSHAASTTRSYRADHYDIRAPINPCLLDGILWRASEVHD